MRYSVLFAGVTALATSVAAAPAAHAHAHRNRHEARQVIVTHVVTVTANGPPPTPDAVANLAADNIPQNGPDHNNLGPDQGVGGAEFTPGGFTPRVTATGAERVTLKNGKVSVSHLEQTLGLSTAAQGAGSTGAPVPQAEANVPAAAPMKFSSDPSGGPPTHPFEVIPNMPHPQPGPNGRDYPGTILLQHNFHRRNQSAGDLIWGFALQRIAMDIANTCVFEHDLTQQNGGYGQSMVAGIPASTIGKVMTDTFYNPQVSAFTGYGQATPDMSDFDKWGFFTQMVWKNTQQVGCYTVDCSQKGGLKGAPAGASPDFTVCNYWPAGNIDGQYDQNVGPKGNMPSMNWDTDSWPPPGN